MRREIVTAAAPALSAEHVEAIVAATKGMLKADIEKTARNYKKGETLPSVPELDWCRKPGNRRICRTHV
jgi:hypothetical protein